MEQVLCVAQYQSFAEQVSAAGLTKKDLLREGKRMIRQLAVQTGTSIKVPQAIIQQYDLRPVYERLIELLAQQFPGSRAIAPLPPSEGVPEAVRKRRRYSMPQDEYQATLSAEASQQRLFVTSALQVLPFLKPLLSDTCSMCLHRERERERTLSVRFFLTPYRRGEGQEEEHKPWRDVGLRAHTACNDYRLSPDCVCAGCMVTCMAGGV